MGACISIHHKANSAMKVQLSLDSTIKPDNTALIHPSPTMDQHVAAKPQLPPSPSPATFSEYGSKEETFFDSQAWLESDDEFMSVKGDFTPSRGNTPMHPSLTHGSPRVNVGVTFMDHTEPLSLTSQPSPTPTEKRRRLLDLFKESLRDNITSNFEIVEQEQLSKDAEMSLGQDGLKPKSESNVGSKQGCFKSLISVRSIGKQKSPSPNRNLRGNPVVG